MGTAAGMILIAWRVEVACGSISEEMLLEQRRVPTMHSQRKPGESAEGKGES